MRFENGVGHELFAVLMDKTRKEYRKENGGGERKGKKNT